MIRIAIAVASTLLILIAGCAGPRAATSATPARPWDSASPSLGYLEHRGRQYPLRELMDSSFRSSMREQWARDFRPEQAIARQSDAACREK